MFWWSPVRRTGSRPGSFARPANRWAVVAILASGVTVAATACSAALPPPASDDVSGPEWRTDVRRSPGAATQTSPAALTEVSVRSYDSYDRVVFAFAGDRPGYRVSYDRGAAGPVLRVTIVHAQDLTEQRLTPQAEAVAEVVQHPASDLVIDTVIELADATAGARPPFRVGLDVGVFYVDVSHPSPR
jgi:hypothetical protein